MASSVVPGTAATMWGWGAAWRTGSAPLPLNRRTATRGPSVPSWPIGCAETVAPE
jgi:hypothetical protein